MNEREIDFEDFASAKLISEVFVSGLILRHDHQARCSFVEAMQSRATPAINAHREKRVEPLARFFGCHGKSEVRILIDIRVQASACLSLLFAGSYHRIRREAIVNKLIYVGFDEFAIDDPGFIHQYIAIRIALRGFEKNIPWRTPAPRVSRQLK